MKTTKLILSLVLIMVSAGVMAQVTQGVITYELRMDIHSSIPEERSELRAMIPQFRTDNFELFFTPTESLYKIKEDPSQMATAGGGGMRMMMRMPRSETYIDRQSNERIVFQDVMGSNFLIVDTIGIEPWKFANEQMEIAGYMCLMAWQIDSMAKQEITAWFTPNLPPFLGPDRYTSLPGTVLAVDINNGERVWVARNIEAREVKPADVRKPSRGQRMTRAEFNKFIEEQMQRLNPGGAPMRFF